MEGGQEALLTPRRHRPSAWLQFSAVLHKNWLLRLKGGCAQQQDAAEEGHPPPACPPRCDRRRSRAVPIKTAVLPLLAGASGLAWEAG